MFHQYRERTKTEPQDFTAEDIEELYYITPLENLESVLRNGLLSHKRSRRLFPQATDVSNNEVQERRATKLLERAVPDKKPLVIHRHAVLYLNPHNAMMHNMTHPKVGEPKKVCALRVHKDILKRGDAVLSNMNAAKGDAEFYTKNAFRLDSDHADKLTSPSSKATGASSQEPAYLYEERIATRQAEVLVPYQIDPRYFVGLVVKNEDDKTYCQSILSRLDFSWELPIVPSMFFTGDYPYTTLKHYPISEAPSITEHAYPDSSDSEDEFDVIHLQRSNPETPSATPKKRNREA